MKHDNTRIYQRSLELIDVSKAVMDDLPSGYGFLADQLRFDVIHPALHERGRDICDHLAAMTTKFR